MSGVIPTNMSNVIEFLSLELGIEREFAQKMVLKHEEIVRNGIELQNLQHSIAEEVIAAEAAEFGGDLPEVYYDPNFDPPNDKAE